MWRYCVSFLLIGLSMHTSASERSATVSDVVRECNVETRLKTKRGFVVRDQMPQGSDPTKPCRTVLRSPEGKILNVTLNLAILKHKKDFVRIIAYEFEYTTTRNCEPCHREEVIQSKEITIEFLLTSPSVFVLEYSIMDVACPPLNIEAPLHVEGQDDTNRAIGSKVQFGCLNAPDFKLVGERQISCEALPSGLAAWSAPLPTCQKISNCPEVKKINEVSGHLVFRHPKNEIYRCKWVIDASNLDAEYIDFVPRYRSNSLVSRESSAKIRGLAFYDGEGRLDVDSGKGSVFRTRDSMLKVYLSISPRSLASAGNASFSVRYEISRKKCPVIDEESFPLGKVSLTDEFFVGSIAEIECEAGHKLEGKFAAICKRNGEWSYDSIPKCVPIRAHEDSSDTTTVTLKPDEAMNEQTTSQELESTTENDAVTDMRSPSTPTVAAEGLSEGGNSRVAETTTEPDAEGARSEVSSPGPIQHAQPVEVQQQQQQQQQGATTRQREQQQQQRPQPQQGQQKQEKQRHQEHQQQPQQKPPQHQQQELQRPLGTAISTSTDSSTTAEPAAESEKSDSPATTDLPVVEWAKSIHGRLQRLDLNKKQDQTYLAIVIAVASAVAVSVALCCLLVSCCFKHTKVPVQATKRFQNPMYSGRATRRLQDISFRMPKSRKRAEAKDENTPRFLAREDEITEADIKMEVLVR